MNKDYISVSVNAGNVQIQQGTVTESSQKMMQNDSPFDYAKIDEAIQQILKYESMFYSEFGERTDEVVDVLKSVQLSVEKKDEPSRIKTLLSKAKSLIYEIGKGTTISVLAGGISNLLSSLGV